MSARCCVAFCPRRSDVLVRGKIGGSIYYCRRHAKRWDDPQHVPQPATAIVLAGRFWNAERRDGSKPRK